eukprot:CAMPEP_0176391776 /NCGR_PEP_ID=MMETSP0126-20121128/40322_1 /TAXON_ID=141414 ORGANISM="Strombidinopsis acuminatum, Strain SPMC142" /NCGR_SAMPLE_ID=MMETSP0126 /ASSEMBLY_ACC=CAM_ASM_000229 /LENGTH=38 /DNA_ID= /DNA_START= /DNA_END= /DNA_ORIENTATION=
MSDEEIKKRSTKMASMKEVWSGLRDKMKSKKEDPVKKE